MIYNVYKHSIKQYLFTLLIVKNTNCMYIDTLDITIAFCYTLHKPTVSFWNLQKMNSVLHLRRSAFHLHQFFLSFARILLFIFYTGKLQVIVIFYLSLLTSSVRQLYKSYELSIIPCIWRLSSAHHKEVEVGCRAG